MCVYLYSSGVIADGSSSSLHGLAFWSLGHTVAPRLDAENYQATEMWMARSMERKTCMK